MLGAAVPKAAVYKYCDARTGEHDISAHPDAVGLYPVILPVAQSALVEKRPNSPFRHSIRTTI